jgi:hypothetical protein
LRARELDEFRLAPQTAHDLGEQPFRRHGYRERSR